MNNVPPGYKQTEVGEIPEDWEVQTGEQITTLIGKGGSPRWQGFEYTNSGMLFVTSENVRDEFLDIICNYQTRLDQEPTAKAA